MLKAEKRLRRGYRERLWRSYLFSVIGEEGSLIGGPLAIERKLTFLLTNITAIM